MAKKKYNITVNSTLDEKREYLRKVVYENVKHSATGKLLINTNYCKKVCEIFGYDWNKLSKVQKFLLRSDIAAEQFNPITGIEYYIKY